MNRRRFIKTGLIFVPTLFVCNGGIARLGNLEPEVGLWMANVKSLGNNWTSKSLVCNDYMIKALKANNLRSSIVRLNTLTGIGAGALRSVLIRDVNPSVNDDPNGIDDADFSESVGLTTGGASNEWIITGCKQSDLYALDATNHSFTYGAYVCASNNQNGFAMGEYNGSDYCYLYVSNGSSQTFFSTGISANQIGPIADSAGTGLYVGSYNSAVDAKLYKQGVQIGTSAVPGLTQNVTFWVGFGDVNNQNTIGVAVSTKTWGGYFCGRSIAAASQPILNDIWKNAMRILGRTVT